MDEEFKKYGFKVVRNLYDTKNHGILIPNLFEYIKTLPTDNSDEQTPNAPAFYKNIEMCKVQIKILSKMEKETGLRLYPTYTYCRVYQSDSILDGHKDRPACEISVTINVGYDGDYNWPLWIKDNFGKDHKIILEPGDGLIYLGCDNEHWREPADERVKNQCQLFLHYVNQDGKNEDQIYDMSR